MLEELKIEDSQKNALNIFVRAELYPKDGDIFSDVDNWYFNVDQDEVPEWFVSDYEKTRVIAEVKKWYEKHVFIGVDDLKLSDGDFYIKDCKNAHYGNSTSEHYGNSTSEHWDNSTSVITEWSSNKRENIILMDNSTLKDCKSKTIYQAGSWKLELV